MNNLFVYCEIEEGNVADVSLELLTKGRSLANQLNCQLEAVVAGTGLKDIEKQILPYGVDKLHVFDGEGLYPYTSLPHTAILVNLFKEEQPQICLMKKGEDERSNRRVLRESPIECDLFPKYPLNRFLRLLFHKDFLICPCFLQIQSHFYCIPQFRRCHSRGIQAFQGFQVKSAQPRGARYSLLYHT